MGHGIADNISAEAPCSDATSLVQHRQRLANIVQLRILEQLFFKEISNLGDELFSGGASCQYIACATTPDAAVC